MPTNSLIYCPTCKKTDTWHPENPNRPFCSERCKLIDLGEWASETHAIPGAQVVQNDENLDNDNEG